MESIINLLLLIFGLDGPQKNDTGVITGDVKKP